MSVVADTMKRANAHGEEADELARRSRAASRNAGREYAAAAELLLGDRQRRKTRAVCVRDAVESYMRGFDWLTAEEFIDRCLSDCPDALRGYLVRSRSECQERIRAAT